jgi:hypothetical protein
VEHSWRSRGQTRMQYVPGKEECRRNINGTPHGTSSHTRGSSDSPVSHGMAAFASVDGHWTSQGG